MTTCIFVYYADHVGKPQRYTFDKSFRSCDIYMRTLGDIYVRLTFSKWGISQYTLKYSSEEMKAILIKNRSVTFLQEVYVERYPIFDWVPPLIIKSCNEIMRYASGVDIGFTFNPKHLYNKLLNYNGKRNYKIIDSWSRSNG